VSELAFLSPSAAPTASPLARALDGARGVLDLSLLGKVELRGGSLADLPDGVEAIPITPERALVICDLDARAAVLATPARLAVDVTAALAGVEVEGEALFRRLTDLDPGALPAAGKVADVPALVCGGDGRYRIFFPQEYGNAVVETVRDLQEGLRG
jgi:hypothetical protein